MSTLLSIDPGTKNLGWALFEEERFVLGGCSRTSLRTRDDQVHVHVETIQAALRSYGAGLRVYGALESMKHHSRRARSNPNDLLDVQMVGGLVAGHLCVRVRTLPATQWKGSIPKSVHHERITRKLDAAELVVLQESVRDVPSGNHKEVLDAVGIGLYHLGRTFKGART